MVVSKPLPHSPSAVTRIDVRCEVIGYRLDGQGGIYQVVCQVQGGLAGAVT